MRCHQGGLERPRPAAACRCSRWTNSAGGGPAAATRGASRRIDDTGKNLMRLRTCSLVAINLRWRIKAPGRRDAETSQPALTRLCRVIAKHGCLSIRLSHSGRAGNFSRAFPAVSGCRIASRSATPSAVRTAPSVCSSRQRESGLSLPRLGRSNLTNPRICQTQGLPYERRLYFRSVRTQA